MTAHTIPDHRPGIDSSRGRDDGGGASSAAGCWPVSVFRRAGRPDRPVHGGRQNLSGRGAQHGHRLGHRRRAHRRDHLAADRGVARQSRRVTGDQSVHIRFPAPDRLRGNLDAARERGELDGKRCQAPW